MQVEVLNSNSLYGFLSTTLPFYPFKLFMHIITEPYISLLTSIPAQTRQLSEIYLDEEKEKINGYAVKRLANAGYRVFYVKRLHGKVIVIGTRPDYIVVATSNLTSRSFANIELVVVIKQPTRDIIKSVQEYFISPVKERAKEIIYA